MTTIQRMNNDIATIGKRQIADKTMRNSRIRNDELTIERRDKADKIMDDNRLRNDELTVNRREIKDENHDMALLAISLGVLLVVAVGIFFIFI